MEIIKSNRTPKQKKNIILKNLKRLQILLPSHPDILCQGYIEGIKFLYKSMIFFN